MDFSMQPTVCKFVPPQFIHMLFQRISTRLILVLATGMTLMACYDNNASAAGENTGDTTGGSGEKPISKPLVSAIYTADPSAHVFNDKIYIYPSHDIESGIAANDNGDHFAMRDYHVFSMDSINGAASDEGVALDIKNIPWAGRQLWAPDAAFNNGTYYLYFPAKDKKEVFRIGVATSTSPGGPFKAEPTPIAGSFSIDPAVFKDDDGSYYMYFGGIRGGQLQRWRSGTYDSTAAPGGARGDEPALSCKVGKLSKDMKHFNGAVRNAQVIDKSGKPLAASDNNRRFFEGSWMHKWNGKYYFSYSTGDTHFLVYATGSSPYGPFTYQGVIMNPVKGWTTHHSIIEFKGKWYIFYHDTELSGKTWLRNIKVTELKHNPDGSIALIEPYTKE